MCKYKNSLIAGLILDTSQFTQVGATKLYFTGSGDFNKNMRSYANSKADTQLMNMVYIN